jgi:pantoate--beta-alanine ligase
MKIIRSPKKIQAILEQKRREGRSVGFVPTMGALHEGHLSLVCASNRENDITVVSIFVNPTQFGPREDYAKYPRVLGSDQKLLRPFRVDYLFCPTVRGMYPRKERSLPVKVAPSLVRHLCGKFRPGHFQGVATVVAKLLKTTGPCRLYLGAKDYQQTVVIRRLAEDLDLDVRIRVMPTVREKDGLAMSSRNRYLNSRERRRALAISQALFELKKDLLRKKAGLARAKAQALRELKKSVDRVQYLEVVDPVTLQPLKRLRRKMVALTACFVGKTRLIDNVTIAP